MSEDDLGRRLLAEVEEKSLSEILAKVTAKKEAYGFPAYTGIGQLDRLIALFHAAGPTLSSTTGRRRPACLEIASPGADDGKTEFLYYLIAIAVLPQSAYQDPLSGQQSAVIFFDCDGTFNINRLATVMRHYISSRVKLDKTELEATIEHALQHLHVLSPSSMASLIRTVEELPAYLYNDSCHYSVHRRVHSIVIDSATAFYWADRNDTETAAAEGDEDNDRARAESGYPRLRAALQKLCQELSCSVIYTARNVFGKPMANQPDAVSTGMPKSWLSFPTIRLLIKRNEVRGLPPAMSAEEAAREAKDRDEVVGQGRFSVVVNKVLSEEWPTEVREEMSRRGNRKLAVRITEEGVEVEAEESS